MGGFAEIVLALAVIVHTFLNCICSNVSDEVSDANFYTHSTMVQTAF